MMRIPKRRAKIVCGSCGWYVVATLGGHSDCIGLPALRQLYGGVAPRTCPACGNTDVREVYPTIQERVSPAERVRELAYELGKLRRPRFRS